MAYASFEELAHGEPRSVEGAHSLMKTKQTDAREIADDDGEQVFSYGYVHRGAASPTPGRARREVVKERATLLQTGEPRAIRHAAIDERSPFAPHRVKEKRHRTRSMECRGQETAIEDGRSSREQIEDRDGQRHAATLEITHPEKRLQPRAKERPPEKTGTRARIPEVRAAKSVKLTREIRTAHSRGPRSAHQRSRARARHA